MRRSLSAVVFAIAVLLSCNSFADGIGFSSTHWQALGDLNGMGFAFTVESSLNSLQFGVSNINHTQFEPLPGTSSFTISKVVDHYMLTVTGSGMTPINLGASNQFDFYYDLATASSLKKYSPVDYMLVWYGGEAGLYSTLGQTRILGASPVPIPASAFLLGSGFLGLAGFGIRRRRSK